jgi:hypothetical protein
MRYPPLLPLQAHLCLWDSFAVWVGVEDNWDPSSLRLFLSLNTLLGYYPVVYLQGPLLEFRVLGCSHQSPVTLECSTPGFNLLLKNLSQEPFSGSSACGVKPRHFQWEHFQGLLHCSSKLLFFLYYLIILSSKLRLSQMDLLSY